MSCTFNTLYGTATFHEPIICELIASKAIQRLHHIHQYGILDYIIGPQHFTRYDHSLRVMILLQKNDAPLLEQIAGLLHDVSHTVFSHLGDIIFEINGEDSYQDSIHKWYLEKTDIPEILNKYNIAIDDILHKKGTFLALEQEVPNLCADRASYIIDGAYAADKITKKTVLEILQHLHFDNGIWFFDSLPHARIMAECALFLWNEIFATPWNFMMNYWVAQAIHHALTLGILNNSDIHFGTDDKVWNILKNTQNRIIQENITKACTVNTSFTYSTPHDYDHHIAPRFRGIDPYIYYNNALVRLTMIDNDFYKKFHEVRARIEKGWYVKLVSPNTVGQTKHII